MKTRLLIACSLCAALAVVLAVPVISQDKGKTGEPPKMTPEMEAWAKAGTPGEHHKRLQQLAGEWRAECTSYCDMSGGPGGEPTKTVGKANVKSIMDGRYFIDDYAGEMMPGMPFTGMGVYGYDNIEKAYFCMWLDSMSTGYMLMKGAVSADGKTINWDSEYKEPSGATKKCKSITTFDSKDKHTFHMFDIGPEGAQKKTMEIVYTRAK